MTEDIKFIEFKFMDKKDEKDPFDLEEFGIEQEKFPGRIFWRKDLIVGFCSAIEEEESYLIVGISEDGARMQFKVNETLEEVKRKLNDSG